jgi:hypothetical protein
MFERIGWLVSVDLGLVPSGHCYSGGGLASVQVADHCLLMQQSSKKGTDILIFISKGFVLNLIESLARPGLLACLGLVACFGCSPDKTDADLKTCVAVATDSYLADGTMTSEQRTDAIGADAKECMKFAGYRLDSSSAKCIDNVELNTACYVRKHQ